MNRSIQLICAMLLVPSLCLAQTSASAESQTYTPPPLVNAPETVPPSDPGPPTPLPPGYDQPPTRYGSPNQYPPPPVPYATSPYGQPYIPSGKIEPPGPEIGLMFTETAFGALTAATTGLLGYYLLLKPLQNSSNFDQTVTNLLFVAVFAAVPMAVSQTELSLANGSRFYYSESWPGMLSSLLTQAAVVGLYYWVRGSTVDAGESLLLIGTIAAVPVATMIFINLTKTPRYKLPMGGFNYYRGALNLNPDRGLQAAVPLPQPVLAQTSRGVSLGIGIPLLSGTF